MEGPIWRYREASGSLFDGSPVTYSSLYDGTMRIMFGIAKKMIVADRLNAFVKPVFDAYESYDGGVIALAAILYTVQLYCDFSGTIDVSLGMGRVFGVAIPENFRQLFFSKSPSEFWQRWHITLGLWFKDYLYYPVSLSAPCKALSKWGRKRLGKRRGMLLSGSLALFCVWFANGLWHGAAGSISSTGCTTSSSSCLASSWNPWRLGWQNALASTVAPHRTGQCGYSARFSSCLWGNSSSGQQA